MIKPSDLPLLQVKTVQRCHIVKYPELLYHHDFTPYLCFVLDSDDNILFIGASKSMYHFLHQSNRNKKVWCYPVGVTLEIWELDKNIDIRAIKHALNTLCKPKYTK